MIRHIVALRWAAATPAAEIAAIHAGLAAVAALIQGAGTPVWFKNVSPEDVVVHGFRDGFEMVFDSAAARDAYLIHPAHQAVGAQITAATGGPDGIQVIDIAG